MSVNHDGGSSHLEKLDGSSPRPTSDIPLMSLPTDTDDAKATAASTVEAGPPEPTAGNPPLVFTVPNGGLEAWGVVLGGFLTFFATLGYITSFGVYQAYYVQTLQVSESAVAWIGSIQLCFQFAMGIITGPLFDKGHGRVLMIAGSIIYVLAIFMTSLCDKYWQVFLSQGVFGGLGLGLLFLPAPSVVPHWFSTRRAIAMGLMITGTSVGGVVFPIMLNNLLPKIGYAQTVRAAGYTVLGALVLANILVKPRLPGRKKRPPHMQFPAPDIKAVVTHKAYLFTIAGGFFIMAGVFTPQFYLQVYAETHGVNHNMAFYLLPILNGASVFGRTLPNLAADKFGVFNMLAASSAAAGIIMFCWLPTKSEGALIAFSILYGFFSGAYISLLPACIQSLSSHVGEIGVRQGLAWAVIAFAALSGAPIDGALLGKTTLTWWRPIVFSGVVMLAGTAFILIARVLHAAERGHSRV